MRRHRRIIQVLSSCLTVGMLLLTAMSGPAGGEGLPGIATMADLDRRAGLHFAIMSDHKGDSPLSSVEFARMAAWVEAGRPAFVIGMGDHLRYGWENSFIPWIGANRWWREHLYPNVADGENGYYSPTHRQGDYGKGAPTLKLVDLSAHAKTVVRENGCEYYAKIRAGKYTVHLIQMHFSDEPEALDVAFPAESRAWMMQTLADIQKGEKDLIVVGAHSRKGYWDDVLTPEQRHALLHKADLLLSATTHSFRAWVPEGFEDGSTVCMNTGAVDYPGYMSPEGYVEVHVLPAGEIVGQYVDLTQTERRLQRGRFAWVKPRGERMRSIDLRPMAPGEDMAEVVGTLKDSVSAADLGRELSALLRARTGADAAQVAVRTGLPKGPVTREAAWQVFQKNRNLRVVRVPRAQADSVLIRLKLTPVAFQGESLRIGVPHPTVPQVLAWAGLTYRAIEPQGIGDYGLREVDLLVDWLKGR
ncbi:MAG: hypothetical protein EXS64_01435 [Candidatus Latescibacteria bacterium]|nr:hypothetical protein [Candidatus Latescibacterota bacterium]